MTLALDRGTAAAAPAPASPHAPVWTRVCGLAELEPFWGEAALVAGEQVALFRLQSDRVTAVTNRDPATGAYVISRGIVGSRNERPTIASPLHKEVYDLVTGECFTSPELRLATVPVRVHAGAVEVAVALPGPVDAR